MYVLGWFETLEWFSRCRVRRWLRNGLRRTPKNFWPDLIQTKTGDISLEEWDAARQTIEADLHRQAANTPAVPDTHTIHSPPPESESPFLISSFSQEELAGTYKRRAILWVIGFFIFGSFSVGILFR